MKELSYTVGQLLEYYLMHLHDEISCVCINIITCRKVLLVSLKEIQMTRCEFLKKYIGCFPY